MKQLILAIDIQKEYITQDRPYYIQGINPSLANAKTMLQIARQKKVPIWHIQHKKAGEVFGKQNPLSDFIADFEPENREKVFTKDRYSCFSSKEFTEEITAINPEEIIIMGYGSSMCCLCTIIDGIHRGFRFTLVEDATASRPFPPASENEMHQSAINILRQYAKMIKTKEWVATQ